MDPRTSGLDSRQWAGWKEEISKAFFSKSRSAFQESHQLWAESTELSTETQNKLCGRPKREFCLSKLSNSYGQSSGGWGGVGWWVFTQTPALSLKAHHTDPYPEVFWASWVNSAVWSSTQMSLSGCKNCRCQLWKLSGVTISFPEVTQKV